MVPRQPHCPIEVWEAVINQASHDSSSLWQLSLTCKAFLPRSRYHLFSSIDIKTVQQLEASHEFLDSHPWVLPLVRAVTLSKEIVEADSSPNVRVLDVVPAHLLSTLPNLRAWRMRTFIRADKQPSLSLHRYTLLLYQRYGCLVRDLELTLVRFDGIADFIGLVPAFTGLQTLTCSNIAFRVAKTSPDSSGSQVLNRLIKPLKIKTLHIGNFVDLCAIEYLALSAVALSTLTLTLMAENVPDHYHLERLGTLTDKAWLSRLSSLTLVVRCRAIFGDRYDVDRLMLQAIHCATGFLERVGRDGLPVREASVEFESRGIARLVGFCFSSAGTSLEGCKALEDALLALPFGRVLFRFDVAPPDRRAGRMELWSPTVQHAFPRLTRRGLLTIDYLKADAPDPLGHETRVECLVTTHDSKHAVTASTDGSIIVWNLEHGTIAEEWLAHRGHAVNALALSPDGPRLVSASHGGLGESERLIVWDFGKGVRRVASLKGHTKAVTNCVWSPDGTLIASTSEDGTLRVWDTSTFTQRSLLCSDPQTAFDSRSLRFSPDARYLAWISYAPASGDCCVVWSPLIDEQPRTFSAPPIDSESKFSTWTLSFDPKSRRIATTHVIHTSSDDREKCIGRVWDIATGAALAVLAGHSESVYDISFSPDGKSVLSASTDRSARLWDADSGAEVAVLKTESDLAICAQACFSPDGKYIAMTANHASRPVQLWRTGDGSEVAVLAGHRRGATHIAFSPNGEFLVSGDAEGIVCVHRLSSVLQD